MAALDYRPDQIARSLKVGRTQTIGVVIPDITNPYYPAVFRGIGDAARASGYGVVLCNSNESNEQERPHLSTLVARRVDGILLACSSGSTVQEARSVPLVFVYRLPREYPSMESVATMLERVALIATEHLIDLGHRRIGVLAGYESCRWPYCSFNCRAPLPELRRTIGICAAAERKLRREAPLPKGCYV